MKPLKNISLAFGGIIFSCAVLLAGVAFAEGVDPRPMQLEAECGLDLERALTEQSPIEPWATGLIPPEDEASSAGGYACYDEGSGCGGSCPEGTVCGVGAQPYGFNSCCLSGGGGCIDPVNCTWHISSCTGTFCF